MTTRTLGPAAGIGWLKQALNLGRHNPAAIFGGAALLLATLLAAVLALGLLTGGVQLALKPGPGLALAMMLVTVLALLLVLAALMVGYMRLLDAVESGRAARATDVFGGFRDAGASARAIGFVLLLALVQNLLIAGLVGWLAPDFLAWYAENLRASMQGVSQPPPTSLPAGFGLAFAVVLVIGLFGFAVQAVGLGQIALRGRGLGGALADGVAGAAKNLLPLLVFLVVMVAALLVLSVALVLVMLVIGLLAKAAGAWLGIVLGLPLYLAAMLVAYVVMFGVMYFLWRDVCGQAAPPSGGNDAVAV
ncbi:hypothetical protein [Vulcaniibacterium gelatinicum]|uniref:hypothetical protein n=1 Tax=Vulcaniibacterium gelatinicum TaxID=2598725 RepID=UPI0011CA2FE9|nr:hypothetical protein [Vulcaniibacterium gelatinicum]